MPQSLAISDVPVCFLIDGRTEQADGSGRLGCAGLESLLA